MEPLQPAKVRTRIRRRPGFLARLVGSGCLGLSLLGAVPGCVPEMFTTQPASEENSMLPCKLATRWEHDIRFTPDTKHEGKMTPTIVGRVTMFASDLTTPVASEGMRVVYLYDDMPDAASKDEPLEVWFIDRFTVRRLKRKDAAGVGYSLVLPMQRYRPDMTRVRLKVAFHRLGGGDTVLYSDTISVTFEQETAQPRVTILSKQVGVLNGATGKLSVQSVSGPGMAPPTGGQMMPAGGGDASNGGSLPTTIGLSPPPTPGSNVPFVLPPPGSVK
jgi:hypothetical protein